MTKTKVIGIAGRFGPRYGRRVKVAIKNIESNLKKKHVCPVCKKAGVKRVAAGIWSCSKCGTKFAGGAYAPRSETVGVI